MGLISQALETLTDWRFFERLCCTVLQGEGHNVDPRGGSGDRGRDAIAGRGTDQTVYQFSLRKDWENKLSEELDRYRTPEIDTPPHYYLLSNRSISSTAKDKWEDLFAELGIELRVLDRSWFEIVLPQASHQHVRNELLASFLQEIPDALRFAINSPHRHAVLGALEPGVIQTLADEKLKQAWAFYDHDKWQEAKAQYEEVIEMEGLSTEQLFKLNTNLGNVYFHLDELDKAREIWRAAHKLNPDNPTPITNVATSFLFHEGDLETVQKQCVSLRRHDKNPRVLNLLGLLDAFCENYGEALQQFKEATTLDDQPEYLLNQWSARVYLDDEITDSEVDKALQKWPANKELRLFKANREIEHFQDGENPEHLERAKELLVPLFYEFFPEGLGSLGEIKSKVSPLERECAAYALHSYGGVFWWSQELDKALELTKAAIELHDHKDLWFQLGQVHFGLGDYDNAILAYDEAKNRNLHTAQLYCQRGNAYVGRARDTGKREFLDSAETEYREAAELDVEQLNNLANVLYMKGERTEAVQQLDILLAQRPNDLLAQANKAVFQLGNEPQLLLEKLLKLAEDFPSEPVLLNIIADVYYQEKDWREALLYYYRVLESNDPNAYQLEEVYSKAARCERFSKPGQVGTNAALDLALKGLKRFPASKMLKDVLEELVKKDQS